MSIRATSRPAPRRTPGTYTCARCGITRPHRGGTGRGTTCRDCLDVLALLARIEGDPT